MTIKLSFTLPMTNQLMNFRIEGKEIYYNDVFWRKEIRLIPKDTDFIKKVQFSRNKLPKQLINMFNLSKEDEEEYNNAQTEEQLAEIIIKDCQKKGLKLLRRE